MAYDPDLADLLRAEIAGHGTVVEKRMFGGLCFMLDGHMAMGTYKQGGMFRVSKDDAAKALAIPGTETMVQAGREAVGFILTDADVVFDDDRRKPLVALALAFIKTLPPK